MSGWLGHKFARSMPVAAALALSLAAGACNPVDRPDPSVHLVSVEAAKQDVARLRERGVISYEEAVRREFAIEKSSYSLSKQDLDVWNAAILNARDYDARRIGLAEYRARAAALFAGYLERR